MIKSILIVLVMFSMFFGCAAPEHFNQEEKMIFTTVRSLQVAKDFRHTGLLAAGDFYKRGMMDEKMKNEIVKIANELQDAINQASEALEIYMTIADKDTLMTLEVKLAVYQKLYGKFADLAIPLLAENL